MKLIIIQNIKRKAFGASLIAPFFYIFSFIYSQEILWEKIIDIGREDYFGGFVVFHDGNIGIIGTCKDTTANFFIYKISQNGDSIFLKIFSQACLSLFITEALIDPEENIYCVGYGDTFGISRYDTIRFGFVIKFSRNYEIIFRKNFHYGKMVMFYDLVLINNNIFVCGYAYPGIPQPEYGVLAKYDTEGNLLWQRLYVRHIFTSIKNINEYFYLTGTHRTTQPPLSAFVSFIKMDSLGDTLFRKGDFEGAGLSMALDSSGNILIAGSYNFYPGPYYIYLLRYDQNGNLLWDTTYLYSNWDWAWDVEINQYGEIFLATAFEIYNPHIWKWHIIKYNSNGETMWEHLFSLPDTSADAKKVMLLNRNEIIAGGKVFNYSPSYYSNVLIIKYLDRSYIKENTNTRFLNNNPLTKIYDITGRKVDKINRKGIYIFENNKKGKLVIIK